MLVPNTGMGHVCHHFSVKTVHQEVFCRPMLT